MDPNNFNLLEDEILKKHPEAPQEIEQNVNSNIHTFTFFGKVVELFIPRIFDSLINIIGGGNSNNGSNSERNSNIATNSDLPPTLTRGHAKSDGTSGRGTIE